MGNFLKTYSQLFEQDEMQPRALFDDYPESLKKDMAKFVKFFNKNVLQQVKCKVNSLNFEKREAGVTLIRSTDIISSQLGILGLVTDQATVLLKLTLDDVKKEAKGSLYLCFLNEELPFADLLLKNGNIMYASVQTGDFVSIETSDYAIGPSSERVD